MEAQDGIADSSIPVQQFVETGPASWPRKRQPNVQPFGGGREPSPMFAPLNRATIDDAQRFEQTIAQLEAAIEHRNHGLLSAHELPVQQNPGQGVGGGPSDHKREEFAVGVACAEPIAAGSA